ncbi:MAG: ubiquinol-cytochrome c reductase iron-sulfur subunit [candidate division KSB1 bacterium]|nr:ubiquinol-cytochrome c reductase iron-sulfur subunit [candidate division KSB1 bacterium]
MKSFEPQSRREFCVNVCQMASLVAFGGTLSALLSGCSSEDPVSSAPDLPRIQASAVGGRITIAIDAASPLASVGSAALVQYSGGALLVAHTAQDSFLALSAICTHQGCTITGYSNQVYTCPCHGSQFNTEGQVRRGPAASPLRKFQTQFANNQLTISLSS